MSLSKRVISFVWRQKDDHVRVILIGLGSQVYLKNKGDQFRMLTIEKLLTSPSQGRLLRIPHCQNICYGKKRIVLKLFSFLYNCVLWTVKHFKCFQKFCLNVMTENHFKVVSISSEQSHFIRARNVQFHWYVHVLDSSRKWLTIERWAMLWAADRAVSGSKRKRFHIICTIICTFSLSSKWFSLWLFFIIG